MSFCQKCGAEVGAEAVFCTACGAGLAVEQCNVDKQQPEAAPALGGEITEAELRIFVGDKYDRYYAKNWAIEDQLPQKSILWHKRNAKTLNWAACFLTFFWLAYRKMYRHLLIGLALYIPVIVVTESIAERYMPWVTLIPSGILICYANGWYRKFAVSHVQKIKRLGLSPDITKLRLEKKGGTSIVTPILTVFIVFLGFAGILASDGQTPRCDNAQVQQKTVELLNQQISGFMNMFGARGSSVRVHSLRNTEELYHNKESGFRACRASVERDNGQGIAAYTIEWRDKQQGIFYVQIADPDALSEKYRLKSGKDSAR